MSLPSLFCYLEAITWFQFVLTMYGEKRSFVKEGKNTTSSNRFSNKSSGYHTICYYAEVRDMFDDFRVGAGWRSATSTELRNTAMFQPFALLLWIVSWSVFLLMARPSTVFLHLNVCFFGRMSSDKALSSSVFHSRASSFRSQTSIFELQVRKWKQLLFEIGYMSHETTMAMI